MLSSWRSLVVPGLMALALLAPSGELQACDAPPDVARTPAERLARHELVARGKVVGVRSLWRVNQHGTWARRGPISRILSSHAEAEMSVVIEVEEAWKGTESRRLVVHDDGPDSCCGMRYVERGQEVLVYARSWDGELWVDGYCHPIIDVADAREDLEWLGPGDRELEGEALSWRELAAVGGLGLFAGLFVLAAYRRRRSKRGQGQA